MTLLNKHTVSVATDNTLVVLNIGNTEIKMDYETAIQLSTWMRVRGIEAKNNAGDASRKWHIIGNLKAITNGFKPW
jgi:hypothetical protein